VIPPEATSEPDDFQIVFVCTGNRARSALAEALLRRRVGGLPVDVVSRGTEQLGAVPALAEAIAVGSGLGIDLSTHRARAFEPGELRDADLVVGFEPFHVATAVVDGGADSDRTFTLRELVDVLGRFDGSSGRSPAERARRAIQDAHARRGGGSRLSAPSVADPLGQPLRVYEATARDIDQLVDALVAGLFGPQPREPVPTR
jgi:protein-tyrosine phosphatase